MRVQRRTATDVVTRDGETAVLMHGQLVRLSEISSLIFELAAEPTDISTLANELELRFGAPDAGTAADATEDAVMNLIHHGVLRVLNS